jgi:hypothetical protein
LPCLRPGLDALTGYAISVPSYAQPARQSAGNTKPKRCGNVPKRAVSAPLHALRLPKQRQRGELLRNPEGMGLRDPSNNPMLDKLESPDMQKPIELTTDFLGEDRHEFVAKLAYELWTQRGRPFGSPDVDWLAAEHAVYASLVASGMITPSPNDSPNMSEEIYR